MEKFTILVDLKEKGKNYQDAKVFEEILSAQVLLRDADIIQSENFVIKEKEDENVKGKKVKEKLWAKIDHGRSFYLIFSNTKDYLKKFFIFLITLRSYSIKIDLEKLSKELKSFIDYHDKNKKKFEALIDRKTSTLNHILDTNMQFDFMYLNRSKFNIRNFKCINIKFTYQKKIHFLTSACNSSSTSFSDYFKQNLKTKVKIARNLTGALKDLAEPWKNFDRIEKIYSYVIKPLFCLFIPTLIAAIFTSGTLGTAFTVAAMITGTCMLVGIVTNICLNVYVKSS